MNCKMLNSHVVIMSVANLSAARFWGAGLLRYAAVLAGIIILSSCTTSSIGDGLRPSSTPANPNSQNEAPSSAIGLAPIENARSGDIAPSPGVVFLPVLGPPQGAVTQLTSAVKRSAKSNSITIIPSSGSGAKYQIKGYFSALDDGSGTRLIFIWDILDRSGKNIHRISGEERTSKRKSDPWTAIDSDMIDIIVERTMQNLRGWMSARA
jgi:hypothetical protein